MIYIGIDNGLTGGLVALSDHPGVAPIAMTIMPVQGKKRGNEVDIEAIWRWVSQFNDVSLVIEKPNNGQTPSTAASMGDSFGVLRAMCALKHLRWHPVPPQTWQKEMLPNCEKGQTKVFALSVARRLWPAETWLATERSKKPHEGLVDGALLAEFGRRKGF